MRTCSGFVARCLSRLDHQAGGCEERKRGHQRRTQNKLEYICNISTFLHETSTASLAKW
jgi:hypothetical protein